MKKVCDLLARRPWLVWLAAGIGLLAFAAGTLRLPGGPGLERIVNGVKLAALLPGIFALRRGAAKETGQTPWILAGLLFLALFVAITLAAWFCRA